ncbi:MAG TPA: hypothetical protein VMO26_20625 [Vicinamibacterales bacterium]|nr:hypothetical protein [Vicinamibacterales bacterium]
MSKKTRYFVITAAAILAVGLTTGLVASYMGFPVAFSRAAGPDELQYVPADAAVVAYANVREIMDSQFRESFRQFEPDTRERDEFEAKTGVNIDHDINSVVAVLTTGATQATSPHNGMLILARGRFEQSRLEALALEHGGHVEDYNGKRLLLHRHEAGHSEMAIGFLEADLIALGGYEAIKQSIDANGGRNIVSTNADLMRQIGELDASNAWAVGRFDAIADSAHVPSEIQAHLPAIQWFSAATHINGGVSGVFKAEARDEESAKNMRDVLNGFLALARMQSSAQPELKTMVDSLQLSGDGKNVAVSFTLPSELFDALAQLKKLEQPR